MAKEIIVKTQLAGGHTVTIPILKSIRSDAAYEDVGIEHPCKVKIEIYGSKLMISRVKE